MVIRQPRYSKEEFARRGDDIYESQVRPKVESGNHGKIVAIDLETGDFEVDAREMAACIDSKPVIQMHKSGLFEWVLAMFADLVDGQRDQYYLVLAENYWKPD
ncbi:hypothetical protein MiTe_01721 [Microcystis aeruginosa NIES-2520]|jgi:hypothetical protein|uniref:Uncharacterized protein n=1 Tax=Microcystis aeruginosa NIES-2520 TaxID=2303982 RepID=A0A5A5RED4_MICAE|nr:hypothetical protein MiTe_01721 [Microcystis aeruginosa NIES-2520]